MPRYFFMKKIIFISIILLCNSTAAIAETIADTQLTLSPALLYFDYTEFSTTDEVLNNETGWVPGLEAKLHHAFFTDWSFDIYSSYYSGIVDYVGQTQTGIPHTTDTETRFTRIGGQINKTVYNEVHLFIGAQSHRWGRNINDNNNVSGINETYKWLEYSIGINSDFYSNSNNVLNIEAAYLLIRNATIDVDLTRVNLGSTILDIADGAGARLNLSWKRITTGNFNYGLSLFAEGWDFGRSNTKLTQGGSPNVYVTEPRSETRNMGLKFNIEYKF